MINRFYIFVLICLLILVTGCIKEDRSNCYNDYTYQLNFIYYGDGTIDIFDSKIENAYVYLFDKDGLYVNRYICSRNALNNFQGVQLDVVPGEYQVVCWSNITQLSEIINESAIKEDYYLYNSFYLNDNPVPDFDSLYYAAKTITIPEFSNGADTMYFASAHINIEVYIEGLETTPDNDLRAIGDPQGWLAVRNVHMGYDFEMNVTDVMGDMFPTLSDYSYQGNDILGTRFHLLRFENTNPIVIDIYNGTGRKVYSINLEEFMAQNNIQVESINEITIPIYIKFDGVYIHVSVMEWDSEDVDPIV